MKGLSQDFPRSPASSGFRCHPVPPPMPPNMSFFKLPWSLPPYLQQPTLVHFYYWVFFTVPNSQTSSGPHSLWSIMFVTSLVSPSSARCWTRMGKGKDAPRAMVSYHRPHLFSAEVVKPHVLDLCTFRFLLSMFIPKRARLLNLTECTILFMSTRHL